MQKGTISVQTENILPIIKKYLYSDQEIFLRELVANAVDATQKLQTLANRGEVNGEIGDTTIQIFVDAQEKTLTISDKGVGMTQDEVVKYITQVAFSGAKEFLSQYKDATNIIGHFGLGFYSAFMVADKVEIFTKSHKDEPGVHWSCDGGADYEIATSDKQLRGTDIVLHINDDATDYLEEHRIEALLKKYCRFLPVPIQFGTEETQQTDDDQQTEQTTIVPKIINDTQPIWTRTPTENTDQDYQNFYHQLYPFADEPLFWIHLNVDYPFNLTGVLYFPKLKGNFELDKNKIHLYCNQVFVTDQVENIVPQFLTLLHGVIDSPDIPLNVSRSYLQSDPEVKKINKYITKKVADKLDEMFKNNRSDFEEKWKDISLLIKYGVLTDDKFAERADKFSLLTNVDDKSFTFTEYIDHIKTEQTDKNNKIIALYTTNPDEQHAYIETARSKAYDVLLMNQQLDGHYMQYIEAKPDAVQFKRVDADTLNALIEKDEANESILSEEETNRLQSLFSEVVSMTDNQLSLKPLSPNDAPVLITQPEFVRRMKEMSKVSGGMDWYNNMPNMLNVVVNTNHPAIAKLLTNDNEQKDMAKNLYDLALLQQNMLKGADLTNFVNRTIGLMSH